jgi:hypothetical protein
MMMHLAWSLGFWTEIFLNLGKGVWHRATAIGQNLRARLL